MFTLRAKLEEGGTAVVYLVNYATAPDFGNFALKAILKDNGRHVPTSTYRREVEALTRLNHPRVCRYRFEGGICLYVLASVRHP